MYMTYKLYILKPWGMSYLYKYNCICLALFSPKHYRSHFFIILLHTTQKLTDVGTVIELFTGMQMLFRLQCRTEAVYVHHKCQFSLMYSVIETVNDAFPVLLFVSKLRALWQYLLNVRQGFQFILINLL